MIFSTKTTYGLRAMINLAQAQKADSVSLAKIAKKENISLKYLERLFAYLKKAGLVKANKGAGGGYQLIRSAKQINLFEIIESLEGRLIPFHCLDDQGKVYCNKSCDCGANFIFKKVQQSIKQTLKKIKLSQLI